MERKSVFINPFVDRGFKILFGQKESKDLLIELLNDLLEGERHIEDLTYMDKENLKKTIDGRGVIFDLKCVDKDGAIFIIELQNAAQPYFYERGLYIFVVLWLIRENPVRCGNTRCIRFMGSLS